MLKAVSKYFSDIPGVFIDGVLYCAISWFIFAQGFLGGDEAAKWLEPETKFWLNFFIGSGGCIAGSLKMFRSSTYADHQAEKKSGNTQFLNRPPTAP
jgi:hypothetical protein